MTLLQVKASQTLKPSTLSYRYCYDSDEIAIISELAPLWQDEGEYQKQTAQDV